MGEPEKKFDVSDYAAMNSDIGRCVRDGGDEFDFAALMKDTALLLSSTGAAHAALGAFACQASGVPGMRSTYDIDLLVRREDVDGLLAAAERYNFQVVEIVPGGVWELRHRLSNGAFSSVEKVEIFASGFQSVEDHPYRFEDPSGFSAPSPAGINGPDMPHALVHKALMPRGKDITDAAGLLRTLPPEERIAMVEEARKILRRHGGTPEHEAERRLEKALDEAGRDVTPGNRT